MNPEPALRPARPADAEVAAPIVCLSMRGLAECFAANGRASDQVVAGLFARDGNRFSYRFAEIVEVDQRVAGLLLAYPATKMSGMDLLMALHIVRLLGPRAAMAVFSRLMPMSNVREAERGEFYISNVGVLPEFQGRGYGERLMSFAEEQARASGLDKCSLNVDEKNEGAIHLYQRLGYKIVHSGKFSGRFAEIESGYHRMVKELK